MRTRLLVLAVAVLILGVLVSPATATMPDENGNHTVMICHVTNSETNEFVLAEVDVAAFDGEGASDHSHHVAKDGRVDFVAVNGSCDDGGGG